MEKKMKIAVIGLGSRGNTYAESAALLPDECEIVACADVLSDRVKRFGDKYGVDEKMRFSSGEELLAQEQLADIAFICTMDRLHYGHAMAALERGYHLLLEKPISPVLSECIEIADLAKKKGLEVIVCHVLRYTNEYRKLKELVDSGAIGDVVSIEAHERVVYWHQAHSFVRGNWSNSKRSSPMILQKSCHDMDILYWLAGRKSVAVSSFGSLTHFKASEAPEGATERCTEACPHYLTCPYSVDKNYLEWGRRGVFTWPIDVVSQVPTMEALEEALRTGPYGRCVYHCDNDVVDHQVVNVLFEDGVTANFNMSPFTAEGGRKITVMGTKGDLESFDEDIVFSPFIDRFSDHSVRYSKESQEDNFGHGGGDSAIVRDMLALLTGKYDVGSSLTRVSDSIESHVIALAAEESRVNGGKLIKTEDYIKANS